MSGLIVVAYRSRHVYRVWYSTFSWYRTSTSDAHDKIRFFLKLKDLVETLSRDALPWFDVCDSCDSCVVVHVDVWRWTLRSLLRCFSLSCTKPNQRFVFISYSNVQAIIIIRRGFFGCDCCYCGRGNTLRPFSIVALAMLPSCSCFICSLADCWSLILIVSDWFVFLRRLFSLANHTGLFASSLPLPLLLIAIFHIRHKFILWLFCYCFSFFISLADRIG